MADTPTQDNEESRMPLWEHLDELRSSIIRLLIVLGLTAVILFNFIEPVVLFLERPLLSILPPDNQQLYFTGITDKFFIYIKVCLLVSVGFCSPYILFEVWRFISPGLYKHERRFVLPFMLFGSLSFLGGLAFAYFVVVPYSYDFLINFGSEADQAIITLTSYFSLTLKLLFGMGLVFEMPVCLILLGLLGVVDAKLLSKYRRHALLGICVASAIITPSPDAFTMLIVMAPLYLLYEVSILGVRIANRPQKNLVESEA